MNDWTMTEEWLGALADGAVTHRHTFLPHRWESLISAAWHPGDKLTEEQVRQPRTSDLNHRIRPLGLDNTDALLARVFLAQNRLEEAIEASKSLHLVPSDPARPDVPYWWIQVHELAAGRHAIETGEPSQAFDHFVRVVSPPSPGRFADTGFLLQGLYELALLEASQIPHPHTPQGWVRLALAVEDGFVRWSLARGWSPPQGYSAEQREQFRAVAASRTVQWDPVHSDQPPIRSRDGWEGSLMYLEEYLGEFVSIYCSNNFAPEPRPFLEEIGELWDPLDPAKSHQEAIALLTDAHRRRQSVTTAPPRWDEPWHTHEQAAPELEAVVARALAAQGDFDGAQAALTRGLGAHQDWPGWVLQLKALTIGRIFKSAGSTETAFDSLWLAVRIWTEGPRDVDVDLLLETLCELATLGHVSPLHPEPAEWARVVAAMTSADSDDEWHPAAWFDRQFRASISQVAATSTQPATAALVADGQPPAAGGNQQRGGRRAAPSIVVLTGAGISAESGISTFRDINGLWRNHRIEEVASPQGFARNPALVHEFYDLRRRGARDAEPNAAHHALALLERVEGDNMLIITQNVDDLHERAGSQNIIHMHGELNSAWCTGCGTRHRWLNDLAGNPPCPRCQRQMLRPDIVWFGETVYRHDEIQTAVNHCDLLIVVGTSGTINPAAGLATKARAAGAHTHLINLTEHNAVGYDEVMLTAASVGVPQLVEKLFNEELATFNLKLAGFPRGLGAEWKRAEQAGQATLLERERDGWEPDHNHAPGDMGLPLLAQRVRDSRDFLTKLEALTPDDLARYQQQAEHDRWEAETQRNEHRAARLKRAGRLENLYVEAFALADSPLSSWPAQDRIPGLLPGAQDALRDLHFRDYNVVLIATGLSLTGENLKFWRWYVMHFGSSEGLWLEQVMVNWSRSNLQGWDLLVTAKGSAGDYRPDGRGDQTIIELGTPAFPDWSAIVTYLQNRD